MAEAKLCAVDGCGKPVHGKGYCNKHHRRLIRHGNASFRDRLSNGEYDGWISRHLNWRGEECLIWPYWRDKDGYGPIRKMCEAAHGKPPAGDIQAAHSCGRGHEGCIHPLHLRWATRTENQQDMVLHGRSIRGVRNPATSLSEDDVRQIRAISMAVSNAEVGRKFSVSREAVRKIRAGLTWQWLS